MSKLDNMKIAIISAYKFVIRLFFLIFVVFLLFEKQKLSNYIKLFITVVMVRLRFVGKYLQVSIYIIYNLKIIVIR